MKNKTLHIIDAPLKEPPQEGRLLYWRTWDAPDGESALALAVSSQEKTRDEFLQWIHDFAEMPFFGATVRQHMRLKDGFSAWWLSQIFERHPSVYGQSLFEIFKLRAFEVWLEDQDFFHIVLHSNDALLHSTIAALCKAMGRSFFSGAGEKIEKKNTWYDTYSSLRFTARLFQAIRYLLRWLWQERRFVPFRANISQRRGLAIASWFPNYDEKFAKKGKFHSKYWMSLHELIDNAHFPVHWLLVFISGSMTFPEAVRMRDSFAKQTGHTLTFWQECVSWESCWRILRDWVRVACKAFHFVEKLDELCHWPHSRLVITPYIRPLWLSSFAGTALIHSLLFREGIEGWSKGIGAQSAVITPSEFQVWERILFRHARKMGTPKCLAATHSTLGFGDFRCFASPDYWKNSEFLMQMPDSCLCNGDILQVFMAQGKFPQNKTETVEAVRYMYLAKASSVSPINIPDTLLVTTTYYASEVDAQLRVLSEAMAQGLPASIRKVLLKAHPGLPLTPFLERYFPKNTEFEIATKPISELLLPNVVVYAGNSTTVSVEASYLSVPVLVQEAVDDFSLSPLANVKGAVFVRTARDLLRELESPAPVKFPKDFFYLDPMLAKWKQVLNQLFPQ